MTDRPSLLFLTSELPYPPHQGMAIRTYNFLLHLKDNYRLHLLSLSASDDAPERADALREVCERVDVCRAPVRTRARRIRDLLTSSLPDMALRAYTPEFEQALRAALTRDAHDLVHVESIEMAPYALALISERQGQRPRFIFDDLNAEYVLQKRAFETDVQRPAAWPGAAYSFVQWQRLARYERRVCLTLDLTVAVSDWDRDALLRIAPGADVRVVPNGIEAEHYLSYRLSDSDRDLVQGTGPLLVFTGKMDFRPNVDAVLWFCNEILPLIRQRVPGVRFAVVGQRPSPSVQALATQPGVTVTGFVPDVRPYVASADAYVVPIRMGGGTRLKVLEAMVMGKAVVSTSLGCEGYGLTSGEQVVMADQPAEFAEQVISLLGNPERRATLGSQARDYAVARYDWSRIVPRLEAAYQF